MPGSLASGVPIGRQTWSVRHFGHLVVPLHPYLYRTNCGQYGMDFPPIFSFFPYFAIRDGLLIRTLAHRKTGWSVDSGSIPESITVRSLPSLATTNSMTTMTTSGCAVRGRACCGPRLVQQRTVRRRGCGASTMEKNHTRAHVCARSRGRLSLTISKFGHLKSLCVWQCVNACVCVCM